MDPSTSVHGDVNISTKLVISFGSLGVILLGFAIFYCYKTKRRDENNDRRSSSSSMESYQQLYFSKVPFDQLENIDHRIIERWSSVADPSLTFYRVHIQDYLDSVYQPVNEERLRSSIEQSKAMEYAGVEVNFF
ncbi:unnamed protein product [Adineta ricciae]|uniref:Uncharacterized protein n=1 Tax=Adineta ricciae TaxID=249248 RepID=A0A814KZJ8_ADIRI|nr:unnamed protein product [Adineta ricciae]CAF1059002.1 unnamed protein product [Adineta ricciae]